MKEIITIAGTLGSGKSSTAKGVATQLGFKHFSSGDLFRQIAAERGESVEQINVSAEGQKEIDHQVDELLRTMYADDDRMVIDSRMAWHWMPDSFKVFLQLDPRVAALRIYNHMKEGGRVSETAETVEEVQASIERRLASEQKRYFNLYGVNARDPNNFDLVIDTAEFDLQTVTQMVLEGFKRTHG